MERIHPIFKVKGGKGDATKAGADTALLYNSIERKRIVPGGVGGGKAHEESDCYGRNEARGDKKLGDSAL